jgi:hypothetical protein
MKFAWVIGQRNEFSGCSATLLSREEVSVRQPDAAFAKAICFLGIAGEESAWAWHGAVIQEQSLNRATRHISPGVVGAM